MRRLTNFLFPTVEMRYVKYKHLCALDLGSESMLPVESKKNKLTHWLKKKLLISLRHPSTLMSFISFPAVLAERQRQVYEGGRYIIHPLSQFGLFWCNLMLAVNLAHMTLTPFRLIFLVDEWPAKVWTLDYVLLVLNIICMLDVFVRFNTGYNQNNNYVLTRRNIAFRYICSWFIPDLVSSIPLALALIMTGAPPRYILVAHSIACVRIGRICTCFQDMKIFLKLLTSSYVWQRLVRHVMVFVVSFHWCCCLYYVCPIFSYYWHGYQNDAYLVSMRAYFGELLSVPITSRYIFALYLSLSSLFGTGYTLFLSYSKEEVMVCAIIIVYPSVFMVYTVALMLKIYMTKYSASLRYCGLMSQVEQYMNQKLFPLQMKKRVRSFYNYRYQKLYFKEEAVLAGLSEQLRNEITLHSCHRLVEIASLFENVPASVVGTILGFLHAEVYMPNDVIVRAGDYADCMYFISSGTVAVYSLKGVEVSHLDDGDFFGVLGLLMKDYKRAATVVAIEITLLYRMDAQPFREYVLSNKQMAEKIEATVSLRVHETVLIDEAIRRDSTYPSTPTESP